MMPIYDGTGFNPGVLNVLGPVKADVFQCPSSSCLLQASMAVCMALIGDSVNQKCMELTVRTVEVLTGSYRNGPGSGATSKQYLYQGNTLAEHNKVFLVTSTPSVIDQFRSLLGI